MRGGGCPLYYIFQQMSTAVLDIPAGGKVNQQECDEKGAAVLGKGFHQQKDGDLWLSGIGPYIQVEGGPLAAPGP